jgi:hypothetical protein
MKIFILVPTLGVGMCSLPHPGSHAEHGNQKYIEAISLLTKDGFFAKQITIESKSNKPGNNKWLVLIASMLLAALLVFMILYTDT